MYDIIFKKDSYCGHNRFCPNVTIKSRIETLERAKEERKVSGDLVVFEGTLNIVPDENWLFDWEKNNPKSYAYNQIQRELEKKK